MWLRTKDKQWYVHELRGVCYISWVSAKDKANAAVFPKFEVDDWVEVISSLAGFELEAVEPNFCNY